MNDADHFLTGRAWVDPQAAWESGQIIESFRLLERRPGGMGEVWKAEDLTHRRWVAIKRLGLHLQGDEKARKRFLREMKILQTLEHPGIVKLYEIHPEGAVFSMEWLEGQDLRQHLVAHKRLPLLQALRLIEEIAAALQIAHAKGIVHRDLKPENIFLLATAEAEKPWKVKVLDFGIALDLQGTRPTTLGAVGTAYYMAPEQHEPSEEISAAADIYALGQIFYEVVTGTRPVSGRLPPILRTLQKLHADGKLAASEFPDDLQETMAATLQAIDTFHHRMIEHEPAERCSLASVEASVQAWQATLTEARRTAAEARFKKAQASLAALATKPSPEGADVPPPSSKLLEQRDSLFQTLHADVAAYPEAADLQNLLRGLQETQDAADALASELSKADLEDQDARWTQATAAAGFPVLFKIHPFLRALEEAEARLKANLEANGTLAVYKGFQAALVHWQEAPVTSERWRKRYEELQAFVDRMRSFPELVAALGSENTAQVERASKALLSLGPSIVPDLIGALQTAAPLLQTRLVSVLSGLMPKVPLELQKEACRALLPRLESTEVPLVLAALGVLAAFGGVAKVEAKAPILRSLQSSEAEIRQAAAAALGALQIKVLPELLALLQSSAVEARVSAATALGFLGAGATGAFDALLAALQGAAFEVSLAATSALPSILPHLTPEDRNKAICSIFDLLAEFEPVCVPFLPVPEPTEKPKPPHPSQVWTLNQRETLRDALTTALASCGAAHLEKLTEAGFSKPFLVCYEAVGLALVKIGQPSIPLLLRALESKFWPTREAAIFALSLLAELHPSPIYEALSNPSRNTYDGASLALALSNLWIAIHAEDADLREEAARLFSDHKRLALLPLRHALRIDRPEVKKAAAQALAGIGFLACESLPVLLWALQTPDSESRCAILRAIGSMQQGALSALPTLHKLLRDADAAVRFEATKAVQQIVKGERIKESQNQRLVPSGFFLVRSFKGADDKVRNAAIQALAAIGFPAVPALLSRLGDADDKVRSAAIQALGTIGPPAIPALLQRLGDADDKVRNAAIQALAAIKGDEVSQQALVLATNSGWQSRQSAASSLGSMGVRAKGAIPALTRAAASDGDSDVRKAAQEALRKIEAALQAESMR